MAGRQRLSGRRIELSSLENYFEKVRKK